MSQTKNEKLDQQKSDSVVCLNRDHTAEEGATLAEYVLLASLIAVVCVVAVSVIGEKVSAKFSSVASSV